MTNLARRYREEQLTPEELQELRQRVNAASDSELEEAVREGWMNDSLDEQLLTDERSNVIYSRIKAATEPVQEQHRPLKVSLLRWAQWAAVILLPFALGALYYLYQDRQTLAAQEVCVSTGVGEHASVTLPDGTQVTLNSQSALRYLPKTFNKSERRVTFDGEAFFEVAKKHSCPFYIDVDGAAVKVLGTKFNLLARQSEPLTKLTLTEGSVRFTATKTGQVVTLEPNQQVVYDKVSGKMHVYTLQNTNTVTDWKRHELQFINVPLREIISNLEATYGVQIDLSEGIDDNESFTGTLATNNLFENLKVLGLSFHLHYAFSDGRVTLSR